MSESFVHLVELLSQRRVAFLMAADTALTKYKSFFHLLSG